jgi:hypothetical protein
MRESRSGRNGCKAVSTTRLSCTPRSTSAKESCVSVFMDTKHVTLSDALIRENWGVFLSMFRWSYFATFTAKQRITERHMRHEFAQWIRRQERVSQGPVHWFAVVEYDAIGEQPHIHALVAAPPSLSAVEAERSWHFGRAQVLPYDRQRGAAYYLPKTFGWNVDGYDCSARFPPKWPDVAP